MGYKLASVLIGLARWLSPKAWEDAVSDTASHVAVIATMSYLDHKGFAHCSTCAQTQGLYNIAGRAYCHRHKPHTTSTVWAIN